MKIAENIKEIRRHFNLTQAELGALAGVGDDAVSSWERGISQPRMGAVQNLSLALGIPKSVIVEGGDFAIYASKTYIEIERHVKQLNEEQLKQVLAYIKFIKAEGSESD